MFAENNETLIGWKGMLRERGGSAKQPSTVTFVRDITLGWGGALNKILHFDISLFRCLVSSCFTPSSFCRKVFPWMSSASGVSQCCFLSNGTFNNMVTHICAISIMKQCMQATNKGIVLKRINEKLCIGLRCLSSTRVFYCSPDNN